MQVLVLAKTEMQIQLCKCYRTAHTFFLTFSSNFLSCDSWMFIFCVFIPEKYLLLHLLVSSEEGIESCSVKQLLGKINKNRYIFVYKVGVSFQHSFLNKNVYKYI